jgi:diguanylate cyclase (GGDEF)-like protein
MHQYALVRIGTLPQRELSAPKTVLLVAFVWVTLGSLALMGLRLLVRALDIPDEAITVSGDLLLPRLREMGVFLSVFVGVLLLSTMALTAALAGAGEKHFERSLRDELTGAFNRRAFRRLFRREAERSHSLNLPVSIAYIDIDHFKLINDRHGHSAGDNILVEVTRQIQAILRPQDLLFRWGGEEYLILLSHTTRDEAREFSETVRQRVAANVDTPGAIAPEPVTVSIGVATISPGAPGAGADLNLDETDLIEAADQALYSAKASGRNRVVTDLMLDPDRR